MMALKDELKWFLYFSSLLRCFLLSKDEWYSTSEIWRILGLVTKTLVKDSTKEKLHLSHSWHPYQISVNSKFISVSRVWAILPHFKPLLADSAQTSKIHPKWPFLLEYKMLYYINIDLYIKIDVLYKMYIHDFMYMYTMSTCI